MSKRKSAFFFQSTIHMRQAVGTPANGCLQRLIEQLNCLITTASHNQTTAVYTLPRHLREFAHVHVNRPRPRPGPLSPVHAHENSLCLFNIVVMVTRMAASAQLFCRVCRAIVDANSFTILFMGLRLPHAIPGFPLAEVWQRPMIHQASKVALTSARFYSKKKLAGEPLETMPLLR